MIIFFDKMFFIDPPINIGSFVIPQTLGLKPQAVKTRPKHGASVPTGRGKTRESIIAY